MKKKVNNEDSESWGFSDGVLPVLFGDNFHANNISWKRIEDISYEAIGKILVCHLIVESHLDKYLELSTPSGFDFMKAKLTFSQKIMLIEKEPIMTEHLFSEPIKVLNKIRNSYAHDIQSKLSSTEMDTFLRFLKFYKRKTKAKFKIPVKTEGREVEVIEMFTQIFCSFFAGACTALTGHFHRTKTVNEK